MVKRHRPAPSNALLTVWRAHAHRSSRHRSRRNRGRAAGHVAEQETGKHGEMFGRPRRQACAAVTCRPRHTHVHDDEPKQLALFLPRGETDEHWAHSQNGTASKQPAHDEPLPVHAVISGHESGSSGSHGSSHATRPGENRQCSSAPQSSSAQPSGESLDSSQVESTSKATQHRPCAKRPDMHRMLAHPWRSRNSRSSDDASKSLQEPRSGPRRCSS
jgi:hypothetical protein